MDEGSDINQILRGLNFHLTKLMWNMESEIEKEIEKQRFREGDPWFYGTWLIVCQLREHYASFFQGLKSLWKIYIDKLLHWRGFAWFWMKKWIRLIKGSSLFLKKLGQGMYNMYWNILQCSCILVFIVMSVGKMECKGCCDGNI